MAYKPKQCYINAKADGLKKAIDKCNKSLTENDALNTFEDVFSLSWTKCDAYNNGKSKSVDIVENTKSLRSSLESLSGIASNIINYQKLYEEYEVLNKKYEDQKRVKNMYKKIMNAHANDEDKSQYNSAKKHYNSAKEKCDNIKTKMEKKEKQLKELEKSIEGALGV